MAPQKSEAGALLLRSSDQALFFCGHSPTEQGLRDEKRAAVDENVLAAFTHTAVSAES